MGLWELMMPICVIRGVIHHIAGNLHREKFTVTICTYFVSCFVDV